MCKRKWPSSGHRRRRRVGAGGPEHAVDAAIHRALDDDRKRGLDRHAEGLVDQFWHVASHSRDNRLAVHFTLKQDAAARFGAFTASNINRPLATVLDDRVTSIANIQSRIDSQGQITGLSREEMMEQVVTFRSGALPPIWNMSKNT